MSLILILMVVILVKLIGGSAPAHRASPSTRSASRRHALQRGGDAAVFGFLSFAGFEGAAAGRGDRQPPTEIPRAIRNAVVASGIFYILCILVQTWGFGTDAAGVKAFATSGSPLGDLARSYVGSAMSDAINAGATLSAFASGLGAATAGARILFALARDTPLANMLGRTSTRTGAPAGALTVTLLVGVAAIVLQRVAGVSATNAFFYPGRSGCSACSSPTS